MSGYEYGNNGYRGRQYSGNDGEKMLICKVVPRGSNNYQGNDLNHGNNWNQDKNDC